MITLCIKDNNIAIINSVFDLLSNSNFSDMYFKKHSFRLFKNVTVHYKGIDIENFYSLIAQYIAKCIEEYYEPILIDRVFTNNYFYFSKTEKNKILKEYQTISSNENFNSLILIPIINYIKNNKIIYLEGFVNFRLANYNNDIQKRLEQAINQYIVNKEYYKFVDLLKNYVQSKPPDNIIVNLVYINSEGFLLDESKSFIDLKVFTSPYLSDVSFSNNDYVLNTLIGILPKQIIIHLISKEDQFINTLNMIFSDRIKTCNGCSLCKSYKVLE